MTDKRFTQRGMTLLELLAGMAVAAMVMGGALVLIFHEYQGTDIARTHVTAAHEIGNAARWISQDLGMAESTDLIESAGPAASVSVAWLDRRDFANIPHAISYQLLNNQLKRDYDGAVTTVARNISGVEFTQTGRLITVLISCTPRSWQPEQIVQKTYQVYLRTAEGL